MIRALWTAATGMESQQLNMDVIANNLANVNSSGFKRSRADFQDILYQVAKTPGVASGGGNETPTGIQVGLGSRVASVQKVFSVGDIRSTGNDLDVAIEGDGFFQVTMPTGELAYTRAGALKRDSTGRLTTPEGFPLSPEITIPANATKVSIGQYGEVQVLVAGEAELSEVGTMELAKFPNPSGLQSIGRSLYAETAVSGAATTGTPGEEGFGLISQGYLEGSNVNIMEEMVNMIAGQRAYEVNSKAIQTADDMLQKATNLIR